MDQNARLCRLERQVRGLRIALLVAGAALAALVFGGADRPLPEVIRARAVEVVDGNGRVVVALRADSDSGGWIMVASSVDRRKVLLDSSPSLVITDALGGESVRLSADRTGLASLEMRTSPE